MSITRRLVLSLGLFVAALWLATAAISRAVITHEIDEIYSESLSRTAVRFMPLVLHALADGSAGVERIDGARELEEDLRSFAAGQKGFLAYEVRDRTGALVLRSYDARQYRFPTTLRPGYFQDDRLQTYTIVDARTGLAFTVGEPGAHRQEAVREALAALYLPLLLLIPLLILGVYLIARNGLAPLKTFRQELSLRGGSNLEPIETAHMPIEVRPVAQGVDRLLQRLNDLLARERAFSHGVAEEMREPLAAALADVRALRIEGTAVNGSDRLASLEAALSRLSRFADKIADLSRATRDPRSPVRHPLRPTLDAILAEMTASGARIDLQDRLDRDLLVAMQPEAFGIALRNILENALLHGPGDATIEVALESDWTVHVVSRGAAITSIDLESLKGRFTRGDAQGPGTGLGLAIADQVMRSSGGALILHSPALRGGEGFEVVMQLP